jgi:hypothetical protein
MRIIKGIAISAALAVLIMTFVPTAKAEQGDWSTLATFDMPIQIGNIVLSPGTYMFRLVDIWAPDFVTIYNVDTHHYVGTVMGVTAFRSDVSEKTTFIRKDAGGMEKLLYWFYPDQLVGVKFFSSEGRPEVMAALTHKR